MFSSETSVVGSAFSSLSYEIWMLVRKYITLLPTTTEAKGHACFPTSALHRSIHDLILSADWEVLCDPQMCHTFRRVLISDGCQMARAQLELIKISMTFVCRQTGGVCVQEARPTSGGRNQFAWRLLAQVLLSWYDLTRPYFRGHSGKDKCRNINPLSVHFYMCAGKRSCLKGLWEMGVVAVIFEIYLSIWRLAGDTLCLQKSVCVGRLCVCDLVSDGCVSGYLRHLFKNTKDWPNHSFRLLTLFHVIFILFFPDVSLGVSHISTWD